MKSRFTAFTLLFVMSAAYATAQTPVWIDPDGDQMFTAEVFHPIQNISFPREITEIVLSGRLSLNESNRLIAELPILFLSSKTSEFGLISIDGNLNVDFGNIMLGYEIGEIDRKGGLRGVFGVRLPLLSDDIDNLETFLAGISVDPQRIGAFLPETMTLSAHGIWHTDRSEPGVGFMARAGLASWIYTGELEDVDTEVMLDIEPVGELRFEETRVMIGPSLRYSLTSDPGPFTDNLIATMNGTFMFKSGGLNYSGRLSIPLTDNYDFHHVVIEIAFGFSSSDDDD